LNIGKLKKLEKNTNFAFISAPMCLGSSQTAILISFEFNAESFDKLSHTPIMHPLSIGEHRRHLDATPFLEPGTTIQLQGIVPCAPRVIHYVDDHVTVLLLPLPHLPSLLCLLLLDALSHHTYVFLFVDANPEAELVTQEDVSTHEEIATQDEMAKQEEPAD